MNHIKLLLICYFIFGNKSFSQNFLPTISHKEELKYIGTLCYSDLLINQSTYIKVNEYCELLNQSNKVIEIDTIPSNGFKDITFLKVSYKDRETFNQLYTELEKEGIFIGKSLYLFGAKYFVYPFLLKKEYILASSPQGLFKLGGFNVNDFYKFYSTCFNIGCFSDEEINNNRGKLSDRKIISSISVENIDLWDLYKKYVR